MPYIGNPAVVGDSANTFKLLDGIASFTVTFDATDTDIEYFTADVSFKYTIYNLTNMENKAL